MITLSSCEQIALVTTPVKKSVKSQDELANIAEKNFWDTLHNGDYAHLTKTIELLTAAYLNNPNDATLAAHLGFVHIWKITERSREKTIPSTIVDEITLAKKYFSDAVALNPNDARLQGFLGVSMLASGNIFHDDREQVRGYFQLQRSIHAWPEFNYFTAGYPMSQLDANNDHFKEGLAWQWQTLNLCADTTTLNKNNTDYRPYMSLETHTGAKRACWNSWIAPHNFEGFFLNMGDMLVKQGDWQTAIPIYQNAKLSKDYTTWPFRHLLEHRIQHAKENVALFQKKSQPNEKHPPQTTILFNSGYGCVACHQKS